MELKIVGIKKNDTEWVNLHTTTTTTPYGLEGVAVKTLNLKKDKLPTGVGVGAIIDVAYGCRFDGKAYIETITLKKGVN